MTKNEMRDELIARIQVLEDSEFDCNRATELRAMDDMELIDAFEVASFNTGTRAP